MKCPFCKAIIDDDSWYCDQCGTALKFCPECRQPKRGTECAACGADLISAKEFFGGAQPTSKPGSGTTQPTPSTSHPAPSVQSSQPAQSTQPAQPSQQPAQPQGTVAAQPSQPSPAVNPNEPTTLVGNGWRLPLRAGVFGRSCGVYPEFKTQKYISGKHGEILHNAKGQWGITDLGSTNGTFIDGTRLEPHKAYLLKKGQQLTIATTNFNVE